MEYYEYGLDPDWVFRWAEIIHTMRWCNIDVQHFGGSKEVDLALTKMLMQRGKRFSVNVWMPGCPPENPDYFDAPRLMAWGYASAGIYIPYSLIEQLDSIGTAYLSIRSKDSLQPGDLVFYDSTKIEVGAYVGAYKIITAPRNKFVCLQPLEDIDRKFVIACRPTHSLESNGN